jgi:hypothetical protein
MFPANKLTQVNNMVVARSIYFQSSSLADSESEPCGSVLGGGGMISRNDEKVELTADFGGFSSASNFLAVFPEIPKKSKNNYL